MPFPPSPPAPPFAPPAALHDIITLLDESTRSNDTSAAAAHATSAAEVLNSDSLRDATDAAHRTAIREACLLLLHQELVSRGGLSTSKGAEALANAVRALLAVPHEVTSSALATGAQLLATVIDAVVSRRLALSDAHLETISLALGVGVEAAAARLHPNRTSATLAADKAAAEEEAMVLAALDEAGSGAAPLESRGEEAEAEEDVEARRGRRRMNHLEVLRLLNLSSTDSNVTWSGDEAGAIAAPLVTANYSEYSAASRQLLSSAHVLALFAMHAGHVVPPRLPEAAPKEERSMAASDAAIGVHVIWNTSCDPGFRASFFGARGDKLRLQVPTGPRCVRRHAWLTSSRLLSLLHSA